MIRLSVSILFAVVILAGAAGMKAELEAYWTNKPRFRDSLAHGEDLLGWDNAGFLLAQPHKRAGARAVGDIVYPPNQESS